MYRFNRRGQKFYICLLDELQSIYEVRMDTVGFHVKLRPFLGEFFLRLHLESKFEVHYYTAGTRGYG
jgi:TFIIF-interacting CTD phosphatase-like protein